MPLVGARAHCALGRDGSEAQHPPPSVPRASGRNAAARVAVAWQARRRWGRLFSVGFGADVVSAGSGSWRARGSRSAARRSGVPRADVDLDRVAHGARRRLRSCSTRSPPVRGRGPADLALEPCAPRRCGSDLKELSRDDPRRSPRSHQVSSTPPSRSRRHVSPGSRCRGERARSRRDHRHRPGGHRHQHAATGSALDTVLLAKSWCRRTNDRHVVRTGRQLRHGARPSTHRSGWPSEPVAHLAKRRREAFFSGRRNRAAARKSVGSSCRCYGASIRAASRARG